MTTLVWDETGERFYEAGVDRGVLYIPEGVGVAWNGLTAVEEKNTSAVQSVYFDTIKYNDVVTTGDYAATLKAVTYPDEFLQFEGVLEDQTGVLVANQPASKFHLSYRTMIGDDANGFGAYKIHILYNLTAIPADKEYETLSLDTEPMEFEWSLTAIPEEIEGFRPTAHIIIDSRKVDPLLVADIEAILYGDEENDPRLPTLKGLTTFIRKWDRFIIIDNGDGTWTATTQVPGYITMLSATEFEITSDTAVYLDAETYEISSSEKNEEDL